jgi:hypothetical protein
METPTADQRPIQSVRAVGTALFAVVALSVNAQNHVLVFQSTAAQTALLELFTSEGCSSCPPAEQWLTGLKQSPRLWKAFVPVAFHVDYWDRLGWRDPWSSKEFSDRQRAYAASWGSRSVYTPGWVLDGKEWRDWRRAREGPPSSGAQAGVLTISSGDRTDWRITFVPADRSGGWYDVYGALLANDLTSEVKAGENKGRRLKHDFVVTVLAKSGLKPSGGGVWGQIVLARKSNRPGERLAVAVWVTRSGSLEPLQAVGGWLR